MIRRPVRPDCRNRGRKPSGGQCQGHVRIRSVPRSASHTSEIAGRPYMTATRGTACPCLTPAPDLPARRADASRRRTACRAVLRRNVGLVSTPDRHAIRAGVRRGGMGDEGVGPDAPAACRRSRGAAFRSRRCAGVLPALPGICHSFYRLLVSARDADTDGSRRPAGSASAAPVARTSRRPTTKYPCIFTSRRRPSEAESNCRYLTEMIAVLDQRLEVIHDKTG